MFRRDFLAGLASVAGLLGYKPQTPAQIPPMPEGHDMLWGTYGKYEEYFPHVRWKTLSRCSDEHLKAILATQRQIATKMRTAIENLLDWREKYNQSVGENQDFVEGPPPRWWSK